MQSTIIDAKPRLPEGLLHLPVAKQIDSIDFGLKNFVARAATGSGKTMLVPAYEAMLRKAEQGCIAIRVPTKVVGGFVTSGLRKFWEPLGLKVGILNRDVTPKEEKACASADIVIISDGSLNRLTKLNRVKALYADEAHWLSLNAELDIAIAKKNGVPIRLLSATIDERLFIDYLGPETGNYMLEGRTFPIRKHVIWASPEVFSRQNHDELYAIIDQAAAELKAANESAIFFLGTRRMCEDAAAKFNAVIPCTFVHGGVSPQDAEAWTSKHAGQPFIVFATTAAAVGITLDLHRAYITDDLIDSVIERGMERMQSDRMDDNMVLQAAGRAGRIREGDAYLITHQELRNPDDGDPWLSIKPRPIKPPAEKVTPFEVILAMAQHGITKDEDIDLISTLDQGEIDHARQWLIRNNCLKEDGTLTRMGKYVASFPMSTQYAHLVLSGRCRPCAAGAYREESRCVRCTRVKLTLLGAIILGLQGPYSLLKVKPRSFALTQAREKDPNFTLLPRSIITPGSVPMSLAKLMKELLVRDRGIYEWANSNNMFAKSLYAARKDYVEASKFVLDEGAIRAMRALNLDDPDLVEDVHTHMRRHPLLRETRIFGSGDKRNRPPRFFDTVFADQFRLELDVRPWFAYGILRMKRLKGFEFYSIDMGFLIPDGHDGFASVDLGQDTPQAEPAPAAGGAAAQSPQPATKPAAAKPARKVAPDDAEDTVEDWCDTCDTSVIDCPGHTELPEDD